MNENKLEEYKKVLSKGISQRGKIEKIVSEIFKKEIKNVYLVGCGGSFACMFPCKYILETNSKLPVYIYNSSEFLSIKPVNLSDKSLVILSSYTGETGETVDAAKYVNEVGATTIGFTGKEDSSLGKTVQNVFANDAKVGITDSKIIMLYQVMFNVVKHNDNYPRYEEMMEAISTLSENLYNIKRMVKDRAEKFSQQNKNEKYFMVIGSGPCWGETYSFATCVLEEMQWIIAQPVHAGEYFHGAFEIVKEKTNLLILKGEDLTRNLVNRVENFSKKYSENITIIDTKDYKLPGISDDLRGYFSPLVLSAILDVFAENLAKQREHPLSTRRYMGKVTY